MAGDVTRALEGSPVLAFPETFARKLLRLARRHRVALGIVAAYLAGRGLIFFLTGR
jgi:hypothetical protein